MRPALHQPRTGANRTEAHPRDARQAGRTDQDCANVGRGGRSEGNTGGVGEGRLSAGIWETQALVRRSSHFSPYEARQCLGLTARVDILREAGWTTQIPALPEVAIPRSSSLFDLADFAITTRTEKWFQGVAPGTTRVSSGIDRLLSAWAFADMIARAEDRRVRGAFLLDPEDLDLRSVRRDQAAVTALQAFGLTSEWLADVGYARLYDKFKARQLKSDSPKTSVQTIPRPER